MTDLVTALGLAMGEIVAPQGSAVEGTPNPGRSLDDIARQLEPRGGDLNSGRFLEPVEFTSRGGLVVGQILSEASDPPVDHRLRQLELAGDRGHRLTLGEALGDLLEVDLAPGTRHRADSIGVNR